MQQKSNTIFYHGHIINNIQALDKRKDNYISHRLQFLNQYCLPIQKKIGEIKDDIKFYENMRDTQYQVIQAEPDIVKLKKQIADYKITSSYFENKLDQFDRSIAHMEVNLKSRKNIVEQRRDKCKILFQMNGGRAFATNKNSKFLKYNTSQKRLNHKASISTILNEKKQNQNIKSKQKLKIFANNSIQSGQNTLLSPCNSKQNLDASVVEYSSIATKQGQKLPKIENRKVYQNYYSSIKQKHLQRHQRNKGRIQKIIKQIQHHKSLTSSILINPELDQKIQLNPNTIKNVKQVITQFDHTQALFRECFERKKMSIQKSVSQLQSKLITNKQLFLGACQVIGEKQGRFDYQDFCQLTTDEITTLFISFSWLGRKIYNQFAQKRKNMVNLVNIIKKIQDQK